MDGYRDNFVAFLDILGFKNIINKSNFADVKSIFSSIIASNKDVRNLTRSEEIKGDVQRKIELENYNNALSSAKIYVMSDSIVIAVPCELKESLAAIISICYLIQLQLYKLDTPILLRGAIARGPFYMGNFTGDSNSENMLIFGKGLVDAYLAQENYAIYPRVIVAKEIMTGYSISIDSDFLLPEDEEDGYYYLDTLTKFLIPDDFDTSSVEKELGNVDYFEKKFEESDSYKCIKKLIEDNLMSYNDADFRKKYIWLEKEVNRIKKNYLKKHGKIYMEDVFATPV